MSEKKPDFHIPPSAYYHEAFALISEEINRLRAELLALGDTLAKSARMRGPVPEVCSCDIDYIGAHWPHCPFVRTKR